MAWPGLPFGAPTGGAMGRKKKVVEVDTEKFSAMNKQEKLALFSDFNQLFHYELSKIPYSEYATNEPREAQTWSIFNSQLIQPTTPNSKKRH